MGFFFVIVSVLSTLFFFRRKSPEKTDNECSLVENPRKFFKLDRKTVFNNLCPDHKFCVWFLLIQYLNACKSLRFFYPKLYYKLSFSLFLDVNRLKIARMDNFLLLQTKTLTFLKDFLSSGSSKWDLTPLIKYLD